MSSSRKLSNEEVAALLEGLEDGALDVGTGVLPGKEYQPYALGNDDANLLGDLYTLRLINERFGRQFRNILLPMLRFAPRVQTMPPETKRFDEYLSGLESFLSLTTLRVDELKGSILATIPARLISILVNSFFGGRGDSAVTRTSEFTPTEERIIQIVMEGATKTLSEAWKEVYEANFDVMASEMNPAFLSFIEGNEQVVICSFVVQLPFAKPAAIELVYPLQMLKLIAPLLRSKVQRIGENRDENWATRLREAVLQIPLVIAPRVAEPTVNLTQLLRLQPGAVISIEAFNDIPIYIEGHPLFTGRIGEKDGKMAVSIID
jgi:flagellar motor switch protein FliM